MTDDKIVQVYKNEADKLDHNLEEVLRRLKVIEKCRVPDYNFNGSSIDLDLYLDHMALYKAREILELVANGNSDELKAMYNQ